MKLFNWIFAKKKQEPRQWTIEHNGWEASAKAYNRAVGLPENAVLGER